MANKSRRIEKLAVSERTAYEVSELVFAKVKGFPDWPARITSVFGNRYRVTFFGDNTTYVVLLTISRFYELIVSCWVLRGSAMKHLQKN